jgi:hypothetical protein
MYVQRSAELHLTRGIYRCGQYPCLTTIPSGPGKAITEKTCGFRTHAYKQLEQNKGPLLVLLDLLYSQEIVLLLF